eukprot:1720689-Prymnesium_polylepis.1
MLFLALAIRIVALGSAVIIAAVLLLGVVCKPQPAALAKAAPHPLDRHVEHVLDRCRADAPLAGGEFLRELVGAPAAVAHEGKRPRRLPPALPLAANPRDDARQLGLAVGCGLLANRVNRDASAARLARRLAQQLDGRRARCLQ